MSAPAPRKPAKPAGDDPAALIANLRTGRAQSAERTSAADAGIVEKLLAGTVPEG